MRRDGERTHSPGRENRNSTFSPDGEQKDPDPPEDRRPSSGVTEGGGEGRSPGGGRRKQQEEHLSPAGDELSSSFLLGGDVSET